MECPPFIVAVASGKGGTGKTTVAVNLARVFDVPSIRYLDTDVEGPNAHIFLSPIIEEEQLIHTFIPSIDPNKCTFCGACSDLCRFNALAVFKTNVLVFPELCHSCLGCQRICPENAVMDDAHELGSVLIGTSGSIRFVQGRLKVGEALAPPLIREVKRIGLEGMNEGLVFIDAPPGTSCPVIEAVQGSDYILLVTEPTPFGLHDLNLAVGMIRKLDIPTGVIINRSTLGNRDVWDYCHNEGLSILMEIPDDRKIAEAYSRGESLIESLPWTRELFQDLKKRLLETLTQNRVLV